MNDDITYELINAQDKNDKLINLDEIKEIITNEYVCICYRKMFKMFTGVKKLLMKKKRRRQQWMTPKKAAEDEVAAKKAADDEAASKKKASGSS